MEELSLISNKKPFTQRLVFSGNVYTFTKYREGVGAACSGGGVSMGMIIQLEMCSGGVQCGLQ